MKLTFSECLIQQPIVYEVAQLFDVVTNIIQADVTTKAEEGWVILELHGTDSEIELALTWIAEQGVQIDMMLAFDLAVAS